MCFLLINTEKDMNTSTSKVISIFCKLTNKNPSNTLWVVWFIRIYQIDKLYFVDTYKSYDLQQNSIYLLGIDFVTTFWGTCSVFVLMYSDMFCYCSHVFNYKNKRNLKSYIHTHTRYLIIMCVTLKIKKDVLLIMDWWQTHESRPIIQYNISYAFILLFNICFYLMLK